MSSKDRGYSFKDGPLDFKRQEDMRHSLAKATLDYFRTFPDNGVDLTALGNNLISLPRHGFRPRDLIKIIEHLAHVVDTMTDRELRDQCHTMILAHFGVFEQSLTKNAQHFSTGQIANILNAFATLPVRPSSALIDTLEGRATTKLMAAHNVGGAVLCRMISSYAELGIQPSEDFMKAWERRIISEMGSLTPLNLANALSSLATLRIRPGSGLMQMCRARLEEVIPDSDETLANSRFATPAEIAIIFKSVAMIDALEFFEDAKDLAEMIDQRLRLLSRTGFSNGTVHQINQTRLWFGMPRVFKLEHETDTRSRMEEEMELIFAAAGYPVVPNSTYIADMNHRIDVTLQGNPGVLIEIDGPSHFLYKPDPKTGHYAAAEMNGNTLYQTGLVHKNRPDMPVLRLPYWIVRRMQENDGWAKDITASMARQLRAAGPGMYRADYENGNVSIKPVPVRQPHMAASIPAQDAANTDENLIKPAAKSEYMPPDERAIEILVAAAGPSKPGKPHRIPLTPATLDARAGMTIGSILPAHMFPSENTSGPGAPSSADHDFNSPLDVLRRHAGTQIIAALEEQTQPSPNPVDAPPAARAQKAGAAAAPPPKIPEVKTPEPEPSRERLTKKEAVLGYLSEEPFSNGANDYFRITWCEDLPASEASMKDLVQVLKHMQANIEHIMYPQNKIDVLDFLAANLRVWEEPIMARIHTAKKTVLMDILKTFQKLQIRPSDDFCDALQSAMLKNIDRFSPLELYQSAFAMAELGIVPTDEWCASWIEQAQELPDALTGSLQRADLFWTMAVMHALTGHDGFSRLGRSVYNTISGIPTLPHMRDYHPRRMAHGALWLDLPVLGGELPENRTREGNLFKGKLHGLFQKAVGARGPIDFDRLIPSLKRTADIAFQTPRHPYEVLVQADGAQYTIRTTSPEKPQQNQSAMQADYGLNGYGMLQSAVICKVQNQAVLLRMVGSINSKLLLLDHDVQDAIAQYLIDQSAKLKPGAYKVSLGQDGCVEITPAIPVNLPELVAA